MPSGAHKGEAVLRWLRRVACCDLTGESPRSARSQPQDRMASNSGQKSRLSPLLRFTLARPRPTSPQAASHCTAARWPGNLPKPCETGNPLLWSIAVALTTPRPVGLEVPRGFCIAFKPLRVANTAAKCSSSLKTLALSRLWISAVDPYNGTRFKPTISTTGRAQKTPRVLQKLSPCPNPRHLV